METPHLQPVVQEESSIPNLLSVKIQPMHVVRVEPSMTAVSDIFCQFRKENVQINNKGQAYYSLSYKTTYYSFHLDWIEVQYKQKKGQYIAISKSIKTKGLTRIES